MGTRPTTRERRPGRRRTFTEIARLSHDEVKAELLSVGLKPLELIPFITYYGVGPNPNPKLEAHQRYDWTEHDRYMYADDPFMRDGLARQPKFDLLANDRNRLYSHELGRYVEALALDSIKKKLTTFGKETGRAPQRDWGDQEYRREMYSRISCAEHAAFEEATRQGATIPTKQTKKERQSGTTK